MKRKVVGVLKMRNGSTIEIIEGTMEKLQGFPVPMMLVPTPNGEGYIVDEEKLKEIIDNEQG